MIYRVLAVNGKYRFPVADYSTPDAASTAMNDAPTVSAWDATIIALIGTKPDGGYEIVERQS